MRTTLDIPDELFRQAKVRAALDGVTLKDLIAGYLEQGLRGGGAPPTPGSRRGRSELPIVRPATGRSLPSLSGEEIHRILDDEDATRARSH